MNGVAAVAVPVRRAYADGRFGQIHYRIATPGSPGTAPPGRTDRPPLLCLHMSPNSGRIYQKFMGTIGASRMALAPDTPGFGESDAPACQPTIEDYAAAMGDLVDALNLGEIDVMGYHTGSETCTALALARPRQVRRLVLVSAPIFTPEELVEFRRHYGPVALDAEGAHLVRKWKGQLFWAGPGKTMAMVAEEFADSVRNPTISWWGHAAAFGYDMAAQLAKVEQPVLVLNPDDDLHEHSLRAAPLMQRGRTRHLRGWGHGFLDVHTDAARAIVEEFLDEGLPPA